MGAQHSRATRPPDARARGAPRRKKKLSWSSSLGQISIEEQLWRKDTRNLRPFKNAAQVTPRGYSKRLQRLATDMGADHSFAQAARKMREHHAVQLAPDTLRRHTLAHAKRMEDKAKKAPAHTRLKAQGSEWIIAAADGTMLPIVRTQDAPPGADKRKHRKLSWEEMRLLGAQTHGQSQSYYEATLGEVEDAGRRWSLAAEKAGWALNTRIHAIGDGAEWIAKQAQQRFGPNHRYTVDLYHVCEYLAAAAPDAQKSKAYVNSQKELLKRNQSKQVIAELRQRLETEDTPEDNAPVRKALRYIEKREGQMDYAYALERGLPVGSGMIESGHRHVLQARLKKAGAWWTPDNAQAMAQLRVTRANGLWDDYWAN